MAPFFIGGAVLCARNTLVRSFLGQAMLCSFCSPETQYFQKIIVFHQQNLEIHAAKVVV